MRQKPENGPLVRLGLFRLFPVPCSFAASLAQI